MQKKELNLLVPHLEHLDMFGDKVKLVQRLSIVDLPVTPGTDGPIKSYELAKEFAEEAGFPAND